MFQRLVFTVLVIHLLCSCVSSYDFTGDFPSCESNAKSSLRQCKTDLYDYDTDDMMEDELITGQELTSFLSHMCNNFPMLLECVYNVAEECPSYDVEPIIARIKRTRILCNGSVPVNWILFASLTMGDINVTCVGNHISPSVQICAEMLSDPLSSGAAETITSFFRCLRTQLPAATSIQTVCGTSVRQILLAQLAFAAKMFMVPSDEEINAIRLI